ncbi:helix-turn-helix domain-containing protein [Streptomyces hydrogenans]|uniref:helix-turn-helix domain-containing protein n=1 Tax=Streptomyces hydrogenans TaxID=1873719 RepID=UPI00167CB9B2|nr:helix-turn-helix transcriptional regulator [Streptomyces hydrogenans]GHG04013.1 hypothetical protein GCM10018784_15360 [Streptomyces hydrogenans]
MTAVEERARDERRRRDAELRAVRERVLAGMRRIKEEFGLSYGRLAEKTHYSRSSWERFLNGKQWPSRAAIQQLADVVGQDPTPLIALWEHAEKLARRSRREGAGPEAQGEQEPERGEREGTDGPGPEGRGEGQDEGRDGTAPGPGPEEPTGRGKPVRDGEPLREERPAAGGAPASSREPDGADGSARAGAGPAAEPAGGAAPTAAARETCPGTVGRAGAVAVSGAPAGALGGCVT